MTIEQKKSEIERIKRIINSTTNRKAAIKFTYVELQGSFLSVSHTAMAKDGSFESINDRLIQLGIPTLEELKSMFSAIKEKGSPTNHYFIEFRMKATDFDLVKQVKARRMGNISNSIMA